MAPSNQLTNLQQELLQLFARQVSEADLLNIRALLGQYFAKRPEPEMTVPPLSISPDILALQGSVTLPEGTDWKQARNAYLANKHLA